MKTNSTLLNLYWCTLLLLYFSSPTICSEDSLKLKACIKKYALEQKDPMIVITLNPEENPVYKARLVAFHDTILKQMLTKNVVYVIRSLRQSEVDYFFSRRMNFLPAKEETVICDDEFYETIGSKTYSEVFLLKNGKILQSCLVNEAATTLKLKVKYTINITLTDSVKLDESKMPISSRNKFIIKGSKLIIADIFYNNISCYSTITGAINKHLEINYDYAHVYKDFISSDSSKIGFTCRNRKLISETFNMPEFSIYNLFMYENDIYIPCTIAYGEKDKGNSSDTAFTISLFAEDRYKF